MAALIERREPADAIARQFVPDPRELDVRPGEVADPTGDDPHSPLPGLVHRYPDRVLIKPVHVCPVYCRFCFRRERVGPGGEAMSEEALADAVAYVAARPEIHEVILTGGDPLMMSARRVAALAAALDAIPHVDVVRWHSRVPIADPGRVGTDLVAALSGGAKAAWIAVHCNHPDELTAAAIGALRRLAASGIVLVSQSVLLRGVNDDADTLAALFRKLVANGIRPYYLHQLDAAPGTSHFRVPLTEGQELMRALRGRISGIALPTYVLDIPGGFGKVPVGPSYLDGEHGSVTDPKGGTHSLASDESR